MANTTTNYQDSISMLKELKLNGIIASINEITANAEEIKPSYTSYLNDLLKYELQARAANRLKRSMAGAHFPVIKTFEDYVIGNAIGFTQTDLDNLKDLRWLDNHENILFFGPPGIGKTHLAISTGVEAINAGFEVCFEKMTNLLKLMKTAEISRASQFRLNRLTKCDLVIIDEIGYTPIDRKEANLFFNLVSELYESTSIIITSNKSFDDWSEMMGDEIMTVAMLDRLLHHARIFNLDGKSYRITRKEN